MRKPAPLLLIAALFASSAAAARDPAGSEQAFRDARKAMQAGNLALACPLFEKSMALDPSVGGALNLGDCEERAGRLADAVAHYHQAIELGAIDDRRAIALARIEAHEPRVPRLTLRPAPGFPASARVLRNGVAVDRAQLGVMRQVNPGTYAIVVEAPGRSPRQFDVTLVERQIVDLDLDVGPAASATPAPAPAPVAPPPAIAPAPRPPERAANAPSLAPALVAFGIGGAGLAVGAVTGIMALGAAGTVHDHCPGGVCTSPDDVDAAHRAKTLSVVSTLGFGVGVVASAVGVYLLVKNRPVTMSPAVGQGAAGAALRVTF